MMAVESEQVTADVIEVTEYPHIAQHYQIYGVPKVVFNETIEFEGNRPEASFVGALEAAVGAAGASED